ncbi:type IV pilin protein [Photobacterium sanctipauli]|uniref:Type IV pilin protein n=1 Tax=Photobacterium sanctipauli TaxID=1342794 RepID=A0A2T3NRI7_9GAMM|nr:type IV pilin protein [Photobacterium sanctipauli]PSW18896.1 type IV pilin protein [Photobacterium sanctipauli]
MIKRQKGVTLIELMIAVAIIGVLTAIAYPSYQAHIVKSHRAQAMGDMLNIQLTMEEGYSANNAYDTSIVSAGTCSFCEVDTDRYTLSINTATTPYSIEATALSTLGQDQDSCGDLALSARGIGSPTECW